MTINKTIQKVEDLSMNALPALQTQIYDGWILRFADGYTKRANSINPVHFSEEDLNSKLEYCQKLYLQKNLKVVYKLTSQIHPEDLDTVLENNGYSLEGLTSVQLLSLDEIEDSLTQNLITNETLTDNWFVQFCKLNHVDRKDQQTLKQMLKKIIPKTCYFLLYNDDNELLSCGMCVLESGYIGLFDIVTTEKYRNKGYGRTLVQHILKWGKDNEAKYAYLQVMLNNTAALTLYSKLGFTEKYKYWYRIKE